MFNVQIDGSNAAFFSFEEAERKAMKASEIFGTLHEIVDPEGTVVAQYMQGRRNYN